MRRGIVLALALLIAAAVPATVLAARQWSLTATPTTLDPGVSTAVRLTAKNLGNSGSGITCVRIQVHTSFKISSVAVVSIKGQTSGAGFLAWTAVWPGGSIVAFKNVLGTSPLDEDDEAVFRITGSDSTIGPMNWTGSAADDIDLLNPTSCGSGRYPSATLHFTVGATPTPTPVPTAKPTPTPTAKPVATPSAQPGPTPGATPRPGATPAVTPGSSDAPSMSPGASAAPSSSPDASEHPTPFPTSSPGSDSPPGSGGSSDFEIGGAGAGDGDGVAPPIAGLDGAVTAALEGLPGGALAWGYPAFVLTVPGLLLLLAVGGQALGALAWLPLVRRRLGGFGLRTDRGQGRDD